LERRGGDSYEPEVTSGLGTANKEEDSPADSLERVKVVFLGAPGVGKSSIIRVRRRSFNSPALTDERI
jgi:GTPase SAR1 family protein